MGGWVLISTNFTNLQTLQTSKLYKVCVLYKLTNFTHFLIYQLTNLQSLVAKLANKLQRQLLAKQNRSWEFDLEEGMLDSSKLSRIIIDPFHSLSYKKEK